MPIPPNTLENQGMDTPEKGTILKGSESSSKHQFLGDIC